MNNLINLNVLNFDDDKKILSFILKNYIIDKAPDADYYKLYELLDNNFIVQCVNNNNICYFKFSFSYYYNIETNLFYIETEFDKNYYKGELEKRILEYLKTNPLDDIYIKLSIAIDKMLVNINHNETFQLLSDYSTRKILNYLIEYKIQNTVLDYNYVEKKSIYIDSEKVFNNLKPDNYKIEFKNNNLIKRSIIIKFTYLNFSYEEEFIFKKISTDDLADALIYMMETKKYNIEESELYKFISIIYQSNSEIQNYFLPWKIDKYYFETILLLVPCYFIWDYINEKNSYSYNIIFTFLFVVNLLIFLHFKNIYRCFYWNAFSFKKYSITEFKFNKKIKLFKYYIILVLVIFSMVHLYSTSVAFRVLLFLLKDYLFQY